MTSLNREFIANTSMRIVETAERSVLDPCGWDGFVEVLGDAFSGACIAFQQIDLKRQRVTYDRMLNMDPGAETEYREYYCTVNPWVETLRVTRSGGVLVSEQHHPSSVFRDTEFYTDWLRPELAACCGLMMETQSESLIVLGVHYSVERAVRYDEAVSEVLRQTSKPLRRSLETARLFERVLDRERSVAAIMARTRDICCVVDRQRRVLDVNERAEQHLRRGELISLRSGRLSVLNRDAGSWLEDTIGLLANGAEPVTETRIFFSNNAYQIAVHALPRALERTSPFSRPLFLVIIRNLSDTTQRDRMSDFAMAFGLTPAERRLCEILAQEHTVKEAAALLEIAIDTASKRLKVIFQKTDTHRQSELMALLNRLL